jgi:hypothetical protein
MDIDKVRLYARLKGARLKLAVCDEALKKRLQILEEELLDAYAEEGVNSLRVEAVPGVFKNVGLSTTLWANKREDDLDGLAAHKAIVKAGWGYMVKPTFSTQTLSAEVRTLIEAKSLEAGHRLIWEEALPDYLKEGLKISEKPQLRVTAAGNKVKGKKTKGD